MPDLTDCPYCHEFYAVRKDQDWFTCERCGRAWSVDSLWDQAIHECELKMAKDREQGDYLDGMR